MNDAADTLARQLEAIRKRPSRGRDRGRDQPRERDPDLSRNRPRRDLEERRDRARNAALLRIRPAGSWSWYTSRFDMVLDKQPNPAHHALAAIEGWHASRSGRFLLVTQERRPAARTRRQRTSRQGARQRRPRPLHAAGLRARRPPRIARPRGLRHDRPSAHEPVHREPSPLPRVREPAPPARPLVRRVLRRARGLPVGPSAARRPDPELPALRRDRRCRSASPISFSGRRSKWTAGACDRVPGRLARPTRASRCSGRRRRICCPPPARGSASRRRRQRRGRGRGQGSGKGAADSIVARPPRPPRGSLGGAGGPDPRRLEWRMRGM